MLLESLLTKLAAAGLATKAAAGGTAVVLAASAAGAVDALPESAQNTFDDITTVEVQAEEEGAEEEGAEEEGVDEEGTQDEDSEFGQRVSPDATGEAEDDEPGVDGAEIACEASQGRSGTCDDTATEDAESEGVSDFGTRVSQDATGQDGSEPGVDGEEISSEARADNPGQGEEGGENAPDDVDTTADDEEEDEDGESDEDGGPEGTPGEDAATSRSDDDS